MISNLANVLQDIPEKDQATGVRLEELELPVVKKLGVQWNTSEDVLTFTVK